MKIVGRVVKTIVFLIVLSAVLLLIQGSFIPFEKQDTRQAKTFFEQTERDSVDILISGTSSIMVGISPLRIYEDAQITSHIRGNSRQPPQVMYLDIKEALKTQQPKLVVCAAAMLTTDFDVDEEEVRVRRGMDYMPLTLDKIRVAKAVTDQSEWQTLSSYVLPLARYHSRWEEFMVPEEPEEEPDADAEEEEENWNEYDFFHGQYPIWKTKPIENHLKEQMRNAEPVEIAESSMYWYQKIADLCKSEGIPLLLVTMPDQRQTLGKHNSVAEAAAELGAGYLDYNYDNLDKKCGLDWERDLYNDHHVNARGAMKVTDHFVGYVQAEYGLTESDVPDSVRKQFEKDIDSLYLRMDEMGYR